MYGKSGTQGTVPLFCGLILTVALLGACGPKAMVGEADIARISPEEVVARLETGEAITFIDSRSSSSWETAVAKIPGAVRIPPHEAPYDVPDIHPGNPVVVYCT
jgi:hypothetical protein